jgi:hypothetical protein
LQAAKMPCTIPLRTQSKEAPSEAMAEVVVVAGVEVGAAAGVEDVVAVEGAAESKNK